MGKRNQMILSGSESQVRRKLKIIGLSGIVLLAMIAYFFTGLFNSMALVAMPLCTFSVCYFGNRAIVSDGGTGAAVNLAHVLKFEKKQKAKYLWLLPLVSLLIGYAQGSWKMGNIIDLIVFGCCLVVLLDPPESSEMYTFSMKLIGGFAIFYAASIWVQILLPDVYAVFVNALRNGSGVRINKLASYYTGFTTSPGHTAVYIGAGMLVFAQDFPEKKLRTGIIELFLLVSMLCTGMRMPVLSVCACVTFMLFMYTPPERRRKLFLLLLGIGVSALLVLLIFRKSLREIPMINRVFVSVESLRNGGDISSGRVDIYAHAVSLFIQKPIFGIGWGNFRDTVVGTVTEKTPFDVHNIYLQLLCETGIIGCICFAVPMFYSLVKSIQCYGQLVSRMPNDKCTKIMGFSCTFQMFFLLFGMTDNPLYYVAQQILYFISCSILLTFQTLPGALKSRRQ